MSISALRLAVSTAGGSPTQRTHVGLLRELITSWGGVPTQWTVTGLLKEAIVNRGGSLATTQNNQTALLRQLIAQLGGTPSSYNDNWGLWDQLASLSTVGAPVLLVLALSGNTLAEDAAGGAVVGTILNNKTTSALSLSDDAGGRFALQDLGGGSWRLVRGATALNYESATSHNITIVETLAGATGNPKSTTLSIGVTNVNDTSPSAFSFLDITGAAASTDYTSSITVAGLGATDSATAVLTGAGTFRKNGGAYGTGALTVVNGDTVEVKLPSAVSYSTTVNATVTIGSTSDTFSVTTGAAPDATAPVLTLPTGVQTGSTTATVGATTDEGNGTLYYAVTTSSTAPSALQVEAGLNNLGTAAVASGSLAVASTGAKTVGALGLTASTTYYAHLMHKDASGNRSNVVSSASFTTSAASGLATPVLSLLSSAGAVPVQFNVTSTDYVAGYYGQLQIATDSGFTSVTQDTGAVFIGGDEWARLDAVFPFTDPSGTYYARFRMLRDNESGSTTVALPAGGSATFDASPWSNTVTDTIVVSAASWAATTGIDKSRYLDISNGGKSVRHNNNDGQYAKVRADRVAASTKWHDEVRLDDNWSASRIQIGIADVGVAANANTDFNTGTGGTFTLPGDSSFKGFALNFGIGNNQIEWHANGTSGNFNVPAGMGTLAANDWIITEADMTGASHVYTFYLWDASANSGLGAMANSGASIGSITLTSGNIPGATYRFGGGQKGNGGAGSDAFTWNPGNVAYKMTPTTGFNNPYA